ncbi:MAG: ATP-binding cassette domain-containing protein [Alphaproteobacteria bacterium]|nr:ATP-binding cassette domain-containing protein [Alphaproteobacteria bacterium]
MTLLYVHRLTIVDEAGQKLIDQLSLHLEAGQTLGIAGAAGAGKSLLGNALCGALPSGLAISAGRILVGNRDLAKEPTLNDGVVAFGLQGEPLTATLVAIYAEGETPPARLPPDTAAIIFADSPETLLSSTDEIAVLCGGRLVERAPASHIATMARHPYTVAMLADEHVPSCQPATPLSGCPWRLACQHADAACDAADMNLQMVSVEHATTCLRWRQLWSFD